MKAVFLVSLLLVSSLLLGSCYLSDAMPVVTASAPAPTSDPCNGLCETRCAKSGLRKRCIKYCCVCCRKCNCVPSGTYGNKSECPCYRDMLNSRGKSKCP